MPKLILLFLILLILTSCSQNTYTENKDSPALSTQIDTQTNNSFIDEFIFLGESTTYHLKSRGVLKDGNKTKQVWAPKSGTLMLDISTSECRIILPETNNEIELSDALINTQPKYMMLTFGLNGASGFISRGKEYFHQCYQKLINTIKSSSPNTIIYINSCFPVAKNMDMSNYKIDSKTLNSYINTINEWAREFSIKNELIYINTASVIKNSEGFLDSAYQTADGFHLNASAYKQILEYIKTHPKGEIYEN